MTLDYERYEYPPILGYTNVFYAVRKADAQNMQNINHMLHPNMVEYVERLMTAKPNWKFVCMRVYGQPRMPDGKTTYNWGFVRVYENNEQLGELDYTHTNRNGDSLLTFCYDSHRLVESRKRGSWSKTTNLNKAVKETLKALRPRDVGEQVKLRMETVKSVVGGAAATRRHTFSSAFSNIHKAAPNFVMRFWDRIKPLLDEAGLNYSDDLPELYESMQDATAMDDAITREDGVTIIVRQNDYIVSRVNSLGARTLDIMSSEQLPDEVRRKLGMLKLLEVKAYAPNMGVRCSEDTYFIRLGEKP